MAKRKTCECVKSKRKCGKSAVAVIWFDMPVCKSCFDEILDECRFELRRAAKYLTTRVGMLNELLDAQRKGIK